MDENSEEIYNEQHLDFVSEFSEGFEELLKALSFKYGINIDDVKTAVCIFLEDKEKELSATYTHYCAENKNELDLMLDIIEDEYTQNEGEDFPSPFSLN
jgi:hypothetical protein